MLPFESELKSGDELRRGYAPRIFAGGKGERCMTDSSLQSGEGPTRRVKVVMERFAQRSVASRWLGFPGFRYPEGLRVDLFVSEC